ncbi:SDR family oxidoreductase [Porticoccaceae bacterium]|nr:SDR family oxidoreductase [Porticoccaceae bacterium]
MKQFCSLANKVALVTGAASGIGLACAQALHSAGASVLLTDIDGPAVERAAQTLSAGAGKVLALPQDVADEANWPVVVGAAVTELGGLDVLVNNAGIYIGGALLSNSREQLQRLNAVNIESVFMGMRAAAEVMQPGGSSGRGGSIINLSSVAGLIGLPGHSAYGSTKGAVRLYSKHAAVEFARFGYGIRVNSVHPGVIETPMGEQVFDDLVEVGMAADRDAAVAMLHQMIPQARIGSVTDIANMVLFLAADESSYITGQEFVVDGGASAA